MVGLVEAVCHAPVHAGGEVVLIVLAPAPDGGEVGRLGLVAGDLDRVAAVLVVVGPDRPRFALRLIEHITASPTAVRRAHAPAQAVIYEPEKRRRVSLHDEPDLGVK